MKLNKILILSLTFMLASCGSNVSSYSSTDSSSLTSETITDDETSASETSSEDTTISSDTSSTDISSSDETTTDDTSYSDDTSSNEEDNIITIQEARALSSSLTNQNSVGVAISDTLVSIEAKLIFTDSSIAGSKYWNDDNLYKALIVDETGYVYASVTSTDYEQLKKYQYEDTSYYMFTGYIANYIGMPEIKVINYEWLKNHENNITKEQIKAFVSEEKSLSTIYQDIASNPINVKGVYYGDLVKFTAKYLAKMDDSVLLFTDGNNVIQLHGTNKIGNNFTLNSVYTIYGIESTYIYKPNINYVCHETSSKSVEINADELTYMTATDLYKVKYTNDKTNHYPNYEQQFYSLRKFKGYANIYLKNGNQYIVFTDTYRSDSFSAYTAAASAKALFLKNDSEIGLYKDADFINSRFYDEYVLENVELDVILVPYLYNTQNYWQVYVL